MKKWRKKSQINTQEVGRHEELVPSMHADKDEHLDAALPDGITPGMQARTGTSTLPMNLQLFADPAIDMNRIADTTDPKNPKYLFATIAEAGEVDDGESEKEEELVDGEADEEEYVPDDPVLFPRLAITDQNLPYTTVGEVVVQNEDEELFTVTVEKDGTITDSLFQIGADNIEDACITGSKLEESTITSRELDMEEIFSEATMLNQTLAENLDTEGLFSNDTFLARLEERVTQAVEKRITPPTITSVSPASGPLQGGTLIVITGTNFFDQDAVVQVTVGGVDCASYTVNSDTSITSIAPPNTTGEKDVTVTTLGGMAVGEGMFTYAEEFKFTIDTRMTDTLFADNDTPATNPAHFSGTATSFSIPTSNNGAYSWVVDWGDGSPEQVVPGSGTTGSAGIVHDYASTGGAGEYQITIKPSGIVSAGWMNAFGFGADISGANAQTNKNMLKSIDSQFTNNMITRSINRFAYIFYGARNALSIPANLFSLIDTSSTTNTNFMFWQTFSYYAYNSTTSVIPASLFDSIDTSSATSTSYMFANIFSYCAYNSTTATIPTGLFDSIDTSSATDTSCMFQHTFNNFARNSATGTIPARLFDSIDTSSAVRTSLMFYYAFSNYAYNSTTGTIPAGLFDSIDTSNATKMNEMFQHTFSGYARNSSMGTIPTGLFDSINTSSSTSTSGMFQSTFGSYAYNSTMGTIPTGLFDSIDTSSATDTSYMFAYAFASYANNSSVGSIPAGLLDSIATLSSKDTSGMFTGTFLGYACNSNAGSIPAGLFDSISTSSATNTSYMFSSTFNNYAQNSTASTIPAGLFDSIDTFSSTNTSGMFNSTFRGYAYNSTTGSIPAGLFKSIDLTNATSISGMFGFTFNEYSRMSTIPVSDVNAILGNANFAGKVTAANSGDTSGVFYRTFYNVPSLTGTAQTFINTKLGGINPTNSAQTFYGTKVTDLSSLHANWK